MALIITKIETMAGINVQNPYIRIDSIIGNKEKLSILVHAYISQNAFNSGRGNLFAKSYDFVPSVNEESSNFIKQGYEYLKTLDEYKDAIDILED